MSVPHRVLVADDEPLARDRLAFLLAPHPRFAVVAQCTDGSEALRAISETKPDVAFLDIQMPGQTGLEIAEELVEQPGAPLIVFVTAFDEFALKAFDVSAVDYLVKPVDRERFDQMIERVERRLSAMPWADRWTICSRCWSTCALPARTPSASWCATRAATTS